MLGIRHSRLYRQVYADDTLTEAGRHVRTGTDQAGVDGVTVVQFQARLFANLKALQNTLMQQRYYPQPVKRIAIPKADGTRRPLGILHGFRRGRSVHTALDQVVRLINLGYAWLVDLDIADCFDRINTALLFTFIKNTLKDAELRRASSGPGWRRKRWPSSARDFCVNRPHAGFCRAAFCRRCLPTSTWIVSTKWSSDRV